MKLSRDERRQIRANLLVAKEQGRLADAVKGVATATDMSGRHFYRLVRNAVKEPERQPWTPTPRAVELYYELRGNAAEVARILEQEDPSVPGERQVQRGFAALSSEEREFVKRGVIARRDHSGTLRWEAAYRNAIWQMDAVRLKIWVKLPSRAVVCEVILVYPIECFTRVVPGWMVAPTESSDAVLEAIRDSILITEDSPFGGVPEVIMFDNGLAFLANAVDEAGGMLDFKRQPVQAYSPNQNGKVERAHQTICRLTLQDKPRWRGGPRDERDELLDQKRNPLPFKGLLTAIREQVHAYNFDRPHSALGGLTPARAWELEQTPIRTETPERLRFACKNRKVQKIQKSGVWKHGQWYRALETDNRVKEKVFVNWFLKDERTVDIYKLNGDFLCTARPHKALTKDERRAMKGAQRARFAEQNKRMREAEVRREKRFAPTNDPDGFEGLPPPKKEETLADLDDALFDDLPDLNTVVVE